jgi:hypothetical protein
MTGHHPNCKKEIKYYDKVWLCYCPICHKQEDEDKSD